MTKEPVMGLTFEQVWALFQETDRKMQETDQKMQETDRKMQETDRKMQETAQRIREISEENRRRSQETSEIFEKTILAIERDSKETQKKIGALTNRIGEIVEHLMTPELHNKFRILGYSFRNMARDYDIYDTEDRHLAEVDVFLENGDYALAVEVKTKPSQSDVDNHVKRLEVLRNWADQRHDRRKYLGALAGAVITNEVKEYAFKRGFFVIEQSGDTVQVERLPAPWEPKAW
ncbi:MAG: hypothetical protein LBQ88_20350 [Treponema sp.]|jgi:hypothetical protein|nr:hypothetical protein [Treponema sp.]